jgi:uncharacterized UPF0160 family protein
MHLAFCFAASGWHLLKCTWVPLQHYGREIIATTLALAEDHPDVNVVYRRMYDNFIEALDACDNGISQYPSDITPKYKESTTVSVASRSEGITVRRVCSIIC